MTVTGSGPHTGQSFCILQFVQADVERERLLIPQIIIVCLFPKEMFPLEVSNCSLNYFVTFRRNLIPSEKCSPSVCAAHGRFTNPKMSTACYLWQRPCLPVKVPLTALRNTCHLRHHCFLTQPSSPASRLQIFLESSSLLPFTTTSILLV